MKMIIMFLMVIATLFVGCADNQDLEKKLLTEKWILTSIDSPTEITLFFGEDRVTGFSGVNNFFGGFEQDGKNYIFFPSIAATRKAGSPEAMEIEGKFLDALDSTMRWSIKKDVLTFFNADNKAVLTFEPFSLVGSEWTLTGFNNGSGGVETLSSDIVASLGFDVENKFYGFDGVNNFFGTFTDEEGVLSLIPMGSTLMAGSPDLEVFANRFKELLGNVVAFKINADTFTLVDASGSALLVFDRSVAVEAVETPEVISVEISKPVETPEVVEEMVVTPEVVEETTEVDSSQDVE